MPRSTKKRWLQRLRSDGDMASRNIGRPRGAEAGVCRVFFVDAAAASRDEEAVESVSQDAHFSQIQWSLFSLFHPAVQTIFSIQFCVASRSESRGVFSRCFGYLVLCATHLPAHSWYVHHVLVVALMFTADHPWRRRTGKQSGFAPELQLRDVVWSDESFFRLRDKDRRAWR